MEQSVAKAKELEQSMLDFAVSVVRYVEQTQLPQSVSNQLIRSATSIGANYAEALNASSKIDFRNKVFISKKETAETRYWLRLSSQLTSSNPEKNQVLLDECQKFLMILQKTVNTINGQRKIKDQ